MFGWIKNVLYGHYYFRIIYGISPRWGADLIFKRFFHKKINWNNPKKLKEKTYLLLLNTNTDLLYKVQYWLIVIGTVCAVIILPSTQSRSAIVALGCSFILFLVGNDKMRPVIKKVLKQYGIVILIGEVLLGVGGISVQKAIG